jgi:hypothetical protein
MWSTLDLPVEVRKGKGSRYVVNPGRSCGRKRGKEFPDMWLTLDLPVVVRKEKVSLICGQPWTSLWK